MEAYMTLIEIGKLLRSSLDAFVVGCRVSQLDSLEYGALVRADLSDGLQVFGLISNIAIEDDGLVRQLAMTEGIPPEVLADNRVNRSVPLEISVLATGYRQGGHIFHLLPPRPPLSLDAIYLCSQEELREFTSAGRFGYFRHVLRQDDLPAGELLAAHLRQASAAHAASGNPAWVAAAVQELITLLRGDYVRLMDVLGALGEVY
jgi:hypothetical protein